LTGNPTIRDGREERPLQLIQFEAKYRIDPDKFLRPAAAERNRLR